MEIEKQTTYLIRVAKLEVLLLKLCLKVRKKYAQLFAKISIIFKATKNEHKK